LVNVENALLGFNHTDIGCAIAKDWNFPEELGVAIRNHHNPNYADDKFTKIVSIIFISDYITQSKNIGYCDAPYKNTILFQKCLMKLKIKEESIKFIIEEVEEEIEKMSKVGWF